MERRICPTCNAEFFGNKYIKKVYCSIPCHKHRYRNPEKANAHFWSRVDKSGDCWLFIGARDKWGYGDLNYMGKHVQAHRLAWRLTNGEPGKLDVLHKCDNAPCCNPAHLYLGTDKENKQDVMQRARDPRYLSPDKVRHLRRLLEKMPQKDVADMAGLSRNVVNKLARGRSYRYIT